MKLTAKAIIYPALIIISLVILPRIAITLIQSYIGALTQTAIDISALTSLSTAVGIALAAISFIKNSTDSWSPANLLASITSSLVDLYLFLFLMGLGDVASLGVMSMNLSFGQGAATITYDFKFFTLFQILIVGFAIAYSGLKFYYSKKQHSLQPITQN